MNFVTSEIVSVIKLWRLIKNRLWYYSIPTASGFIPTEIERERERERLREVQVVDHCLYVLQCVIESIL